MNNVELEIYNNSLKYAKQPEISSIEDNNPRAAAMRRVYENARLYLLEQSDWGFARVISKMTLCDVGQFKVEGYEYYYIIPEGAVSVQEVFTGPANGYPAAGGGAPQRNIVHGERLYIPQLDKNVIASNHESISAVYSWNIKNEKRFSANFKTALAYYIASEIASDLEGEESLTLRLKNEAAIRINEAKYLSKTQSKPRVIDGNRIVDARSR
jgi:hypothetical protein